MLKADYEVKLVSFDGEVKVEQNEELWRNIQALKNKKDDETKESDDE